jgi:hypothetical protein
MPNFHLFSRNNAVIVGPPPGVTVNYDHPDSDGHMYIDSVIPTLVIAFICVMIRLATKIWIKTRRLGWDDCKCFVNTQSKTD